MKRILLCCFLLLAFWAAVYGQEFGAIKGTVTDREKTPLPGVAVTLAGLKIAPKSVATSEKGHFRFLSLPVARDYVLTLKLPGFNTLVREKLDVSYARDVVLDLVLEAVALAEEVTVVAKTPVIDPKRTQVGVNITNETIMSLPTARTPWTTLSLVPGMLMDSEDVGGSHSGQQYGFWGHGSNFEDTTWNIDGANITDNVAFTAPAYLNVASYEELQINYGNNDIKSQTGGVQLNFITKRGGNKFSGMFWLDAEDKAWQAANMTPALKAAGYKSPGINKIYLYGASFGGPIVKDTAWFFGSYGIQDIDVFTLQGTTDKTWLASGYLNFDLQLTSHTKLSAYFGHDNKLQWGKGDPAVQAPETLYNQDGPAYVMKGEIECTTGNLFLNLKALYINGRFHWITPGGARTADGSGAYTVLSFYPKYFLSGNNDEYRTLRKQLDINLNGNYFVENILGGDHEFKFGVDYVGSTTTSSDLYEANLILGYQGPASFLPTGQWWEAWLLRDFYGNYWFGRYSAFLQDTATFGRFTLNLGLRYDQEHSMVKNVNIPASPWLPQFMPAVKVDKIDPGVKWKTFSPRLSLTYDLFGNGKDVFKISVARYGSQSGFNLAGFINSIGWTEIDLMWQDLNQDGRVTADELFGFNWETGELMDPTDPNGWSWYSSTINPADPQDITPLNRIDSHYRSPLTDELSVSYEKELFTDFASRLVLFYKKNHRGTWYKPMLADGTVATAANYKQLGTDPIVGSDYYDLDQYFPYSYLTNYGRSYQRYLAAELVLSKRLSHKWMMDASFTYAKWTQHWKGEFLDPTNLPYFDGQEVAPGFSRANYWNGYSGVNARWIFKVSGLYQLPWGISLSGVLTAREGYILADYVTVYRPNLWNTPLFGKLDGGGKFGDRRLPDFWMLNLRMEKIFAITQSSSVALGVDAFNVTNSAVPLNRQTEITAPDFGRDNLVLNPRVFRFGVRFTF